LWIRRMVKFSCRYEKKQNGRIQHVPPMICAVRLADGRVFPGERA
jgi:hypothetical protein